MSKITKYAFLNALGTALYVLLVGLFINALDKTNFEDANTFIAPVAMLMLLVFSVALVGSLIFGRPIVWYIDGKKKEAITLLFATLGIFLMIVILALFLLLGFS